MDRAPVELRILGHTELTTGGSRTGSFVLRQPKRLALLAYLALTTSGGYRRRDQIVALFWPDLDQAHARTQLRKALHALRSTLGADAFAMRGEEELRVDEHHLWCDAVAFTQHLAAEECVDALSLYRGDLLEGLFPGGVGPEFESWLDDQRAALRKDAARAAWQCSTREDLAGQRREAATFARRAVELDPDDEDGVRRLIAALDRNGDRAGALRVFGEWQARLKAEYGAEPAPETRKLVRKVQAHRKGESTETPSASVAAESMRSRTDPAGQPSRPPSVASARAALQSPARRIPIAIAGVALAAVAGLGGWRLSTTRGGADADGGSVPTNAVAALPFRGAADSGTMRIGEGFAEELTTALSHVRGLEVRSTVRSREVLRREDDLMGIARALQVRYVLDGHVRRDAPRLRITLRFVRVADRSTIWAQVFDATEVDLIAEQERVARTAIEALRPVLDSLVRATPR